MSQKEKPTVNVDALINLVLQDAAKKREDAAYGGRMDDGGSGTLRAQVEFYNHGRNGTIPREWEKYQIQLDPEYAEYQRLQKKFGNR